MEYQEGNYPQYEYDYQTSEDNSTAQGFIGYEIYSFMCFLFLILNICGALMCNRYNNNIANEYSKERLIKKKVEKYKVNGKFKDKECSICLDEYMDGDVIIYLDCEHYYHTECSKQWFKDGNSCPLCRSSFS